MAPDFVGGRTSLQTTTSSRSQSQSQLRNEEGIKALRYEEAMEGRPPLSVTVPPPRAPPTEPHPALRQQASSLSVDEDPAKRDSGLAPTTSTSGTGENSKTSASEAINNSNVKVMKEEEDEVSTPTSSGQVPQSPENDRSPTSRWKLEKKTTNRKIRKASLRKNSNEPSSATTTDEAEHFTPITTEIPTDNLIDMDFIMGMSFSNRGSMMWNGKKASAAAQQRSSPVAGQPQSVVAVTNAQALSSEIEEESQKVRSMYEAPEGASLNWRDGRISPLGEADDVGGERKVEGTDKDTSNKPSSASTLTDHRGSVLRTEHELAGGIEDWEDVQGEDVDRYGFICERPDDDSRPRTAEPRPPQRVSTALQLASEAPRHKRSLLRRAPSSARSVPNRNASKKQSGRSLKTIESDGTMSRRNLQPFRSVVNHLPGNQQRRWLDEAGDMLTLPPGLADIAANKEGSKGVEALRKKEWTRSEKWRKMSKATRRNKHGEAIAFEFDVKNSKLIERTWKGIPDRWRATAWYSFLSASAKNHKDSPTDDEIIDSFHQLLNRSSKDDIQIDIDVPRTINCHIMFRRRYRGGQRLLFRVLHCLSLYFPSTGYAQGMASLAATLLCYYDEEKTFVMLVRMWQLRGLEKLYADGFAGLMSALKEFDEHWLAGNEVAKQLKEWEIDKTAYGTRWYLTLFNYSIPFPAQLRVWDVFMLLGDEDPSMVTPERPFGGCLDVIHATGAALIEGTREIVLNSDFENAMKVLTSWIPVKDEVMLMNITKVKWKALHGKQRSRARTLVSKNSSITKTAA